MEGTRFRLVGLVEWLVAAVCVAAGLAMLAIASPDVRRVRPVVPVIAGEATAPIVPANVRPGSISVPELVLPDGHRFAVGAPASALAALGPRAQSGPAAIERDASTQRESRIYRYAGMEFVVVTAGDIILAIYR